ncbi:hypothetical protein ACCAA_510054 [Candidatus Accumulibacter aalborgensis]|uniref:Uncharacterized protein n=1 Tax=Candidatus Accumulibacter aalborgensis TaxID=1860102 RepID=A0A1A8XTY9_9PROT|nr:hypothetical protein ACCAA_510054 [Candidatus Accumulibacter aalborgensis]
MVAHILLKVPLDFLSFRNPFALHDSEWLTGMDLAPPQIMKDAGLPVSLTPDPSPRGRGEVRESLTRLSH